MKTKQREIIFNKFGGRCAYCGCELQKGWHVDHVKPVLRESEWCKTRQRFVYTGEMKFKKDDVMENKMPACASCNINKHSLYLEDFRKLIKGFVTSLNRDSTQYKIAKRYGLVTEEEKEVVFYFETFIEQSPSEKVK